MLVAEQWTELRRLHFVGGVSIKELARRYAVDGNTVRRALRSNEPRRYARSPMPSKLDAFKDQIHRLLHDDARLPNARIGELIAAQGYAGHQTILDAYLREVRPLFGPAVRTYQRTTYRPGELAQFDLWQPRREIPVGFGQTRRGYVLVGALGCSRVGAGALVFSKEAPDPLGAMARCLRAFGGLPDTLVTDREGALHAGAGRPTEPYASFCGQLPVAWRFCQAGDPEAKGATERLILGEDERPGTQLRIAKRAGDDVRPVGLAEADWDRRARLPQIALGELARQVHRPLIRPGWQEERSDRADMLLEDRLANVIPERLQQLAEPDHRQARLVLEQPVDLRLERVELRSGRRPRVLRWRSTLECRRMVLQCRPVRRESSRTEIPSTKYRRRSSAHCSTTNTTFPLTRSRFTSMDVVYEENHRVVLSAVTLTRQGHRRSQLRGHLG